MPLRILCWALLSLSVAAQNSPRRAPDWRAIHESAIIIDGHADTPQRFVNEGFDMGSDAGAGHVDLAKVRAGNLGAQFFSIWPDLDRYRGTIRGARWSSSIRCMSRRPGIATA